ncbi:D19L3 mannosyltransferase, partial [Polypterus senegalus]
MHFYFTESGVWNGLSVLVGCLLAASLGLVTSIYVATLHENDLWFSNIKEVEREISFRTECGLYYSYYKQMLNAPSIQQGLYELINDNITESRRTINILQRMNIYQEVVLAIFYHILPMKKTLQLKSDEHIFKFITAKFGFGSTRDFDAKLYLCEEAFGVIPLDTFERFLETLVLYPYVCTICILTILTVITTFWNFRNSSKNLPEIAKTENMLQLRQDIAYNFAHTVIFGILACSTMSTKTPTKAVFAGSMQLLAGVKLCTGRILTNHPHYEDKILRDRTQQVYQIYARQDPKEVHRILRSFGTDYVIIEDSICYERRHNRGCRLRDLLDVANGHIMDGPGENDPDLKPSTHPRFCDEIKLSQPSYTLYFTQVFRNKTFHVYKLKKNKKKAA